MRRKTILSLGATLLLLALAGHGLSLAQQAQVDLGTAFTFQGQVLRDGAPIDGECDVHFRLYDAAEGGSQVGSTLDQTVSVRGGLFTVALDFGAGVFGGEARWLAPTVQCPGDATPQSLGRQALTPAPQALHARAVAWSGVTGVPASWADGVDDTDDTVSWGEISGIVGTGAQQVAAGNHGHGTRYYTRTALQTAGQAEVHWENLGAVPEGFADGVDDLVPNYAQVIVVAQDGADFTSVQAAIDSITDANSARPYLVRVAPGLYPESVTLKPYVHLWGAGQASTIISSTVSGANLSDGVATLVLAEHGSVRDVTVQNGGGAQRTQVAVRADSGVTQTLLVDVTTVVSGSGADSRAYAIYAGGPDTGLNLLRVTAVASGGESAAGLHISGGVGVRLSGGLFEAHAGTSQASGIRVWSEDDTLWARDVSALGACTAGIGAGLDNGGSSYVEGGSFTGRGGSSAYGLYNSSPDGRLEVHGVSALGAEASSNNRGVHNNGTLWLYGGEYVGRGGIYAAGIYHFADEAAFWDWDVTALGEQASSSNAGLHNDNPLSSSRMSGALVGGSFTGRGGSQAQGIHNQGAVDLTAQSVVALAEGATAYNDGLYNRSGAAAVLRDGVFTGRGGNEATGACNEGSTTSLQADGTSFVSAGASSNNFGLYNLSSATAAINRGVLEGATNAVYRASGTVTVAHSRLEGGTASGAVTCVLVTRGANISTDGATCP